VDGKRASQRAPARIISGRPSGRPEPTSAEQRLRLAPRRLFAQLDLHTESNFFAGFSGDLTDGGLFIATYERLRIGEAVHVELSMPGGQFVWVEGRVAWLREPKGHQVELVPGAGIVFERTCEDFSRAAAHFMRRRDPNFVDRD
jgi:uncharacterized protein (TIGR02266 family)